VNDTTKPPEESDDRAGVATGQQAAAANDPSRADAVTPASTKGNGAGAKKKPAGRSPRPTPAAGQAGEAGSESGPAASGNGREAAPEPGSAAGVDAPTARIRLPQSSNGAAAEVPASSKPAAPKPVAPKPVAPKPVAPKPAVAKPGDGPVNSAPKPIPGNGDSAPPKPESQTGEPRTPAEAAGPVPAGPATGPIPSPGPAAASPPPWNRMPGPAAQEQQQPGPAGGLLDGPTAYLMPDAGSPADPTEPQVRSWSPMRAGRTRPPRRAALQLKRLDPWSMLKLGLVLAVVIFFIWLVAVGVLYGVLDGMGVWDRLNGTYADLVSGEAPTGSPLISAGRVFGLAAVIGAINSLLFAVAVTIGAFVYNVSADLVGGVEVTLSERD
jgi:hypothetical protein